MTTPTIRWIGGTDGHAELIDQTLLPDHLKIIEIRDKETMWDAIKRLAIRGAPAIGVAAALGTVLGIQETDTKDADEFGNHFKEVRDYLASSRPTAVNLFWALDCMGKTLESVRGDSVPDQRQALLDAALRILEEDREICRLLGEHGSSLVKEGDDLLTHCNAGALATAGCGTALAVMFAARENGTNFHVYVDETRPLLQGARLTAWELMESSIPATLICDNMAAHVMHKKGVDKVFVGADRIAANGDAANKIGTYGVAVLAKAHNVPFYVVAPESTFDMALANGDEIPIEERSPEEITSWAGVNTAPKGVQTFSPAFDVTPAELITGIVTEKGVISPVTTESIREVLSRTL